MTNKYCLCLSTYVSAFGFVGFILCMYMIVYVLFMYIYGHCFLYYAWTCVYVYVYYVRTLYNNLAWYLYTYMYSIEIHDPGTAFIHVNVFLSLVSFIKFTRGQSVCHAAMAAEHSMHPFRPRETLRTTLEKVAGKAGFFLEPGTS